MNIIDIKNKFRIDKILELVAIKMWILQNQNGPEKLISDAMIINEHRLVLILNHDHKQFFKNNGLYLSELKKHFVFITPTSIRIEIEGFKIINNIIPGNIQQEILIGSKLQAVKMYKNYFSVGIRDAKDAIDKWCEKNK